MTTQLIAVALTEDGTVCAHAGRAQHWQVYAIENSFPEPVWRLELTASGCLHEWHVRGDGNRHPLHGADVAIAGSGGVGVIRRLAERGTTLVATSEKDPLAAVTGYLRGDLPEGLPHDETACHNLASHG